MAEASAKPASKSPESGNQKETTRVTILKKDNKEESNFQARPNRMEWEPSFLRSENFKLLYLASNGVETRAEALRGRRKQVQSEENNEPMEIDQEEPPMSIPRENPKTILPKPHSQKQLEKISTETSLVNELDNVKIPTTFSQLTSIAPSYAEEVINRLQQILPGLKQSTLTYIKAPSSNPKNSAAMLLNQESMNENHRNFYSCALGFVDTLIMEREVEFMVDSGSMVNVIPLAVALELGVEVIQIEIKMKGVSGD